jgi:hypothetical protein
MSTRRSIRRAVAAGGVLLAVCAVTAGIALAAHPTAGWDYSSGSSGPIAYVSFRAASASKLTEFSASYGYSSKCEKSAGGVSDLNRSSVPVSKNGTFKVQGGLDSGTKKLGTETVTGKFVDGGKKATGELVAHSTAKKCLDVTKKYTANGFKPA